MKEIERETGEAWKIEIGKEENRERDKKVSEIQIEKEREGERGRETERGEVRKERQK